MSELQKQILNMIIVFDNNSLISAKNFLEKLLNEEILSIDPNANIDSMDLNDKIALLKSIQILNDDAPTISFEDALKELECDDIWVMTFNSKMMPWNL